MMTVSGRLTHLIRVFGHSLYGAIVSHHRNQRVTGFAVDTERDISSLVFNDVSYVLKSSSSYLVWYIQPVNIWSRGKAPCIVSNFLVSLFC